MTTLTCPKCTSEMRSYERNGLLVDQCTGCGGLFLDRGELEKLVAAENEWHAAPGAATPQPTPQPTPQDRVPREPAYQDRGYREPSHEERRHDRAYDGGHDRGYDYSSRKRKKKSFLSELFDD